MNPPHRGMQEDMAHLWRDVSRLRVLRPNLWEQLQQRQCGLSGEPHARRRDERQQGETLFGM